MEKSPNDSSSFLSAAPISLSLCLSLSLPFRLSLSKDFGWPGYTGAVLAAFFVSLKLFQLFKAPNFSLAMYREKSWVQKNNYSDDNNKVVTHLHSARSHHHPPAYTTQVRVPIVNVWKNKCRK